MNENASYEYKLINQDLGSKSDSLAREILISDHKYLNYDFQKTYR